MNMHPVDLLALGVGKETPLDEVERLVAPEFARLSPADRREFVRKSRSPQAARDYAAFKKYAALGLVRVLWRDETVSSLILSACLGVSPPPAPVAVSSPRGGRWRPWARRREAPAARVRPRR
jgi:hypothetical protein